MFHQLLLQLIFWIIVIWGGLVSLALEGKLDAGTVDLVRLPCCACAHGYSAAGAKS